jgi:anti-sigma factor RsiW
MSRCEEHICRIDLYLDNELRGDELEAFDRHVKECPSCRRELMERRRFLEQVRAARPLYKPSAKFRSEMAALLAAAPVAGSDSVPDQQREAAANVTEGSARSWLSWFSNKPIPVLVACGLAIAVIVTVWRVSLREARANAFVDMAIETHRRQLAGNLPLEIRTNSPGEISTWFAGKVPFRFRLPASQQTAEQDRRYEITGGRLVNFKGTYAAYVAYRMQAQLISLVVTSTSNSVASGGEETVSRSLTFHTHRKGGLQVVTWSVHNLTYALVSGMNVPASQSCAVCHSTAKGRRLIQDLKSLNTQRINRGGSMLLSDTDLRRLSAFR